MYQKIKDYIEELNVNDLPNERKNLLNALADYIKEKKNRQQVVRLNFICTHNSRRSHLGQIWAQAMAYFYNIDHVECYSGGTEATAMFSQIINTLQHVGFEIKNLCDGNNPIYAIKFDNNEMPVIGFSKVYDHFYNPKTDFAAMMTCDHADQNCPHIIGADKRFALDYTDPKISDNTPEMKSVYAERSKQIATEMKFVFSLLK